MRQFRQQILPPGMPRTTVWGYGSTRRTRDSFGYPAPTIEAAVDRRSGSPGSTSSSTPGRFRPHLLPVDPTLHWANPAGGVGHRDMPAHFDRRRPAAYRGPGAERDAPARRARRRGERRLPRGVVPAGGANLPRGFAAAAASYGEFRRRVRASATASRWKPGLGRSSSTTTTSAPGTLWYHDHALGHHPAQRVRRAGRLLPAPRRRGGPAARACCPGPAPGPDDPAGTRYYEIPLVIQDR